MSTISMPEHLDTTSSKEAASALWAGWALSGLSIAFCLMDAFMKLFHPQFVIDATTEIGWPADPTTLTTLGVILLVSTALYAFPRTAVLGAVCSPGFSAARRPHICATRTRSAHTTSSAFTWALSSGAGSGFTTLASGRCCLCGSRELSRSRRACDRHGPQAFIAASFPIEARPCRSCGVAQRCFGRTPRSG